MIYRQTEIKKQMDPFRIYNLMIVSNCCQLSLFPSFHNVYCFAEPLAVQFSLDSSIVPTSIFNLCSLVMNISEHFLVPGGSITLDWTWFLLILRRIHGALLAPCVLMCVYIHRVNKRWILSGNQDSARIAKHNLSVHYLFSTKTNECILRFLTVCSHNHKSMAVAIHQICSIKDVAYLKYNTRF